MIDFINEYNKLHRKIHSYKGLRLLLAKYASLYLAIYTITPSFSHIGIFIIFFLIGLLETLRLIFFTKNSLYHPLLILSIILSSSTLLYTHGSMYAIIFIILGEIIFNANLNKKHIYIILHSVCYFSFTLIFSIYQHTSLSEFFAIFLSYFSCLVFMLLSKIQKRNKKEIYELNQELKEQNLKLQEYSLKIEELTLEKERTRVAQELHDSLGHYLMAISMHLDFLEKTLDTSPEKASTTIEKTKKIVENSIVDLRKTVYELKENKVDTSFKIALDSLIYNFSIGSSVKFDLLVSPLIENITPSLKDILYKSIKECLTNGIKHGQATSFKISILLIGKEINLTISNRGKTGDKILMSNGLIGIKNRIEKYNGYVNFFYTKSGFKIASIIPIINK